MFFWSQALLLSVLACSVAQSLLQCDYIACRGGRGFPLSPIFFERSNYFMSWIFPVLLAVFFILIVGFVCIAITIANSIGLD